MAKNPSFFSKIKTFFLPFFSGKRQKLKLIAIKRVNNKILCEFTDFLSIHGKTISLDIQKIRKNTNIKHSIEPEDLFLIGGFYKEYEKSFMHYRLRSIDLVNNKITLENISEKINIKILDLFDDQDLLLKMHQPDLLKIIAPYIFTSAYNMQNKLFRCQEDQDQENKILRFSVKS